MTPTRSPALNLLRSLNNSYCHRTSIRHCYTPALNGTILQQQNRNELLRMTYNRNCCYHGSSNSGTTIVKTNFVSDSHRGVNQCIDNKHFSTDGSGSDTVGKNTNPDSPLPTATGSSTKTKKKEEEKQPRQRSRRSRHAYGSLRLDNIPSFQDFMQQQNIVSLYRKFVRVIRPLPSSERRELMDQIKSEFTSNKSISDNDPEYRKRAIREGNKRLKELQAMLSTKNINVLSDGGKKQYTDIKQASSDDSKKEDENEDEVKSVGQGWPWERQK